jgi:2-polyprenyl-3-methyl-5-hydroxy-6-metoxy-1,4-benzoquinol methylase
MIERLKRVLGIGPKIEISPDNWRDLTNSEIGFWADYLKNGDTRWAEEFIERNDPHAILQPFMADMIQQMTTRNPVQILDVGAGPLTYLGKVMAGRELEITAIDPLADEYDTLLKRYGISPVLRTIYGQAEDLVGQFGRNRFDVVHARNCIDHSVDPIRSIEQMLSVVRSDGFVFMHHMINEADNQQYEGLHQWNLFEVDGDLWVGGRQEKVNMTKKLKRKATIETKVFDSVWMTNLLRPL